jgi:hypothetical protein
MIPVKVSHKSKLPARNPSNKYRLNVKHIAFYYSWFNEFTALAGTEQCGIRQTWVFRFTFFIFEERTNEWALFV